MSWLKWSTGRQQSNYEKFLLLRIRKVDLWILKFPVGSYIKPHIDSVSSGRHYRLNIFLKSASSGGFFHCKRHILRTRRAVLFRPDLEEHSVSKILAGTRYVLSLGFVLK